jgi:hypothetical protein
LEFIEQHQNPCLGIRFAGGLRQTVHQRLGNRTIKFGDQPL